MTMTAFTLVEAVIVLVRVRYEGKAFFHYRKDVFFFHAECAELCETRSDAKKGERNCLPSSILRVLRETSVTFF